MIMNQKFKRKLSALPSIRRIFDDEAMGYMHIGYTRGTQTFSMDGSQNKVVLNPQKIDYVIHQRPLCPCQVHVSHVIAAMDIH